MPTIPDWRGPFGIRRAHLWDGTIGMFFRMMRRARQNGALPSRQIGKRRTIADHREIRDQVQGENLGFKKYTGSATLGAGMNVRKDYIADLTAEVASICDAIHSGVKIDSWRVHWTITSTTVPFALIPWTLIMQDEETFAAGDGSVGITSDLKAWILDNLGGTEGNKTLNFFDERFSQMKQYGTGNFHVVEIDLDLTELCQGLASQYSRLEATQETTETAQAYLGFIVIGTDNAFAITTRGLTAACYRPDNSMPMA